MRARTVLQGVTIALIGALALAGCSAASPAPGRSRVPSTAAPAPSPSGTPTASPRLVYTGTAQQNLPYFDRVNNQLIAAGGKPGGRSFIDALVGAGFVKADMEVTADTTTIGLAADNIQFSVRFNGSCLIGQYGNIGYASTVAPVLATGKCLVGKTRPIDW